jgi:hypothetical protein
MGQETAQKTYQRLISEFSDQMITVNEAKTRLANLKLNGQFTSTGLTVKRIWSEL